MCTPDMCAMDPRVENTANPAYTLVPSQTNVRTTASLKEKGPCITLVIDHLGTVSGRTRRENLPTTITQSANKIIAHHTPVAVVVKFVVGGHCDYSTPGWTQRIKYLKGSLHPHL